MLFTQDLPIKIFADKIHLHLKVTPKASQNKIGSILNNNLKIFVTAAPENGQANKFVINLLSEMLNITKSNIEIISGATSQNKVVAIYGNIDFIIKSLQIVIYK